jgi:HK97 family phage portal protein
MADKAPNIVQRFLYGPKGKDISTALTVVEEKGQFPSDNINNYSWSTPTYPINVQGYFGGTHDYKIDAGDLVDSSVVMACLNWLMRVFPRARARVVLETEDGIEPVKNHKLTKLLKRPNPVYAGTQLWRLTVLSYNWSGNAYWRKVRNGAGQVIQLWYEPHWTIRPRRTSADEFVSFYEIYRDRTWQRIDIEDVVHFRWVLSPENQMVGMGPIDSGLREIFSDNSAAQFTAAFFRNFGVFSRMISPKEGDAPLSFAEITRLIAEMQAATTGDNRFKTVGATVPVDMHEGQTDMSKMSMRESRMTPEERICSLIGIHPAITGLAAGAISSTYNNKEEAMRDAYNNNILPCYDDFAETLDIQLVSDFTSIEDETVEFDTSRLEVLKGDIVAKETSAANLWIKNAITRAQLKIRIGEKPALDGSDDGYMHELVPAAAPSFGPPIPPNPNDPTEATKGAQEPQDGKAYNGNGKAHDILWESKAKKPTVESETDAIMAAVGDEIERIYKEAERAI